MNNVLATLGKQRLEFVKNSKIYGLTRAGKWRSRERDKALVRDELQFFVFVTAEERASNGLPAV
jgi:hypothetical protein